MLILASDPKQMLQACHSRHDIHGLYEQCTSLHTTKLLHCAQLQSTGKKIVDALRDGS